MIDPTKPDMATPQGTVAPRYKPNCKHAYMNDGFDCPFCLRDRLAASENRVKELEKERNLYYLDPKGGELWLVLNGSSMKGMINLYAEKRQPFVNAALMLVEDELRKLKGLRDESDATATS